MLSAKCVYLFVWLNGSEVEWKGKVLKGHGCVSTWVLLHCYSYQYSAVIPDLVRQTTKALFHPQKKAFILLLKVQYIDEVIDNLSKISKG